MRILSIIFLFLAASQVYGSNKLVIENYGLLPETSKYSISPSGERIAYRYKRDGQDLLAVVDLSKGEAAGFVNIGDIRPESIYFATENHVILVAEQNLRLFGYRGRHDISAAFVYDIKENSVRQLLTAGRRIASPQTQLGRIVGISKENEVVFMPAYSDNNTYDLMQVNLNNPLDMGRIKRGTTDTIDYFMNNKGEVIARERYNNKSNIHKVESLIDGDWHEIFKEEVEVRTKGFSGVTTDFKSLVMISQDRKHGRWAYYTMSLKDGAISGPIFSHDDKDVEHVISGIDRVVEGVRYSGFKPDYEYFDASRTKEYKALAAQWPNNPLTLIDYSADKSRSIYLMEGDGSTGDYLLLEKGQFSLIGTSRPKIKPEQVNPVIEFRYTARDGLKIPTLITVPNVEEVQSLPAIILPHGGPESYDKIGFDWLAQYFASKGFLVVQPQFRGSKGFGPEHLLKGRSEWGRKMQDDLTDAVTALVSKNYVDKTKVCIVGLSYGGYAAMAGITFTPDLYKCAIAINGVSDVEDMLDKDRRDYGSSHWVVSYWEKVLSNGDVKEDHLESISPINFTEQVKTPILLIHGERDEIVSVNQSRDFYDELKDSKKAVTYVELEHGDHYLSKSQNRLHALKAIDQFINEQFKFKQSQ